MNNLKKIRKENRITQTKITEICEVSQQTVSNWENEKTEIDFDNLKKLSNFFKVSIDEIIGNNFPNNKSIFNEVYKELIKYEFPISQYNQLSQKKKEIVFTVINYLIKGLQQI